MEIEQIRKLVEELTDLMDARKLDELKISSDGVKVVLRRGARRETAQPMVFTHGSPVPHAIDPAAPAAEGEAPEVGHIVHAPMVGTFYLSPAPDADDFVGVGDSVTADSVLCIIEAMKVMNELKAEVEGIVREIRVESGESVEYGQALFVIEPKSEG
ncbi:acetyl-CoA carboxylase biotin carboxyl carrier protein [bacterium]|nr:acetyl-CoA carboxylase biotin carboxyl carrier protein [bacterium]